MHINRRLHPWENVHFSSLCFIYNIILNLPPFQCDISAQGGSPSSTLTCSTASPCSESPSSTLSPPAESHHLPHPLPLPSPHYNSSNSPCGTLSSRGPSPARAPAPGGITGHSHGPPAQSPTSTLESKDSGIIGKCSCCVYWQMLYI